VLASANPYFGYAPVAVDLNATVTGDSPIQTYKWDYTNDGVWDYVSGQSPQTSHTYSAEGTYQAVCQVVDSMVRTTQDSVTINVYPATQAPVVTAAANPTSGQVPLSTSLSGIVQSTNQILYYLWDFDDDGIVDWGSDNTASTTYLYGEAGNYNANLTVIDDGGLTASDSVYIQVSPGASPPEAHASATPVSGSAPLTVSFTGTGVTSRKYSSLRMGL
jgi:PKD repeat protein